MAMSASASLTQEESRLQWRKPTFAQPERTERRAIAGHLRRPAREPLVLREPGRSAGKRIFDVLVAGAAILFFAPLFAAIALAIKLTSPGPVLFRQYRYGYRNR